MQCEVDVGEGGKGGAAARLLRSVACRRVCQRGKQLLSAVNRWQDEAGQFVCSGDFRTHCAAAQQGPSEYTVSPWRTEGPHTRPPTLL